MKNSRAVRNNLSDIVCNSNRVSKNIGLYLSFYFFAELSAVRQKDLDAIVFKGIVRGTDDDTRVESKLASDEGNTRSRDHAGRFDLGSAGHLPT